LSAARASVDRTSPYSRIKGPFLSLFLDLLFIQQPFLPLFPSQAPSSDSPSHGWCVFASGPARLESIANSTCSSCSINRRDESE
jgi:hypothetical protein